MRPDIEKHIEECKERFGGINYNVLQVWIPVSECKDGYLYRICARNSTYGVFNEEEQSFTISRFKFTNNYLFPEYHWDTGEPYGTAKPYEELGKVPHRDNNRFLLMYLNNVNSLGDIMPDADAEELYNGVIESDNDTNRE